MSLRDRNLTNLFKSFKIYLFDLFGFERFDFVELKVGYAELKVPIFRKISVISVVKNYQGFKGFKGFGALRLKLYLELLFRILKIILRFNFKLHFEPKATKNVKKPHPQPLSKGRGE